MRICRKRITIIYGAPDIVVEILSVSTAGRDKTIKKSTYERFGVKEYWLADTVHRQIDQFVLVDGTYRLAATLTPEDTIASAVVPCLHIELAGVFEAVEEEINAEL